MSTVRMILATLAMVSLSGCNPPAAQGPDSPLTAERIRSIARSGSGSEDRARRVRQLIEQLDSPDSAVRWVAIERLHEETGQTLGYRYDDPSPRRDRAIERWIDWYRQSAGFR